MHHLRPARLEDAPILARVHIDTWRSTYGGIVPAAHLAGLSLERSAPIPNPQSPIPNPQSV
ncbi:MAG: hypothetical protein BWY25_03118 [Chloroflexi bacterium ADurb.Bin222]|nr:MAG: hypothetical protein BWY25_03118 [Chloroflexi bacterium ADurb.Bin222]